MEVKASCSHTPFTGGSILYFELCGTAEHRPVAACIGNMSKILAVARAMLQAEDAIL